MIRLAREGEEAALPYVRELMQKESYVDWGCGNLAAEALAADLQEARFEAARLGRPLHIQMAAGDAWCWSVATESACPCGQSQPCELRSAQPKDHAGIRLVMARSMLLGANGVPESPGGATFESRQGARLRVDMQALGRARVCTAAGSAQRYPPC